MLITFRADFGAILAIFLGLAIVGIVYNQAISWLEKEGYIEGFVSFAVAAGVLLTIAPLAILSWQFVLIILGAFVASGSPMIWGSVIRYITKRKAAQDAMRNQVNDH